MGSCLSKGGKKAPTDDDKTPYSPSRNTLKEKGNEPLPPPEVRSKTYDVPPHPKPVSEAVVYDTPQNPPKALGDIYDTPKSPVKVEEAKSPFVRQPTQHYETVEVKNSSKPVESKPQAKVEEESTPTKPPRLVTKSDARDRRAPPPPSLDIKSPPRTESKDDEGPPTPKRFDSIAGNKPQVKPIPPTVDTSSTEAESRPPPRFDSLTSNNKPISQVHPMTASHQVSVAPPAKTLPPTVSLNPFEKRPAPPPPSKPTVSIIPEQPSLQVQTESDTSSKAPIPSPRRVNQPDSNGTDIEIKSTTASVTISEKAEFNIQRATPQRDSPQKEVEESNKDALVPKSDYLRVESKSDDSDDSLSRRESMDIELRIDEDEKTEVSAAPVRPPRDNQGRANGVPRFRKSSIPTSPTSTIKELPDMNTSTPMKDKSPSPPSLSSSNFSTPSPVKQSRIPSLTPMDTPIKAELPKPREEDEMSNVSSVEVFPDSEDEDDVTPIPPRITKTTIKSCLSGYSTENIRIKSSSKVQPGTRTKIMSCVEKWMQGGRNESRVMIISGVSGVGKTHLAMALCEKHRDKLAGSHFFHYNTRNLGHNSAKALVISIAHSLCGMLPNYINTLSQKLNILEHVMNEGDLGSLFDTFIKEPLESDLLQHEDGKNMLLIIDGFEQCEQNDRELLSQIVCNFNDITPQWLHLLIMCRNDNQILGVLENVKHMELKNGVADNQVDLKRIMKEPLSKFMDKISLDGGLTQLAKKTEGLLLCAHFMGKCIDKLPEDKKVQLREIDTLFPTGLGQIYQTAFTSFRNALDKVSYKRVSAAELYGRIIGVLVVVKEPIHQDFLLALFSANAKNSIMEALAEVEDFIIQDREDKLSFYHQNVIDWLTNENEAGDLSVNATSGLDYIAEMCIKWLAELVDETIDGDGITPELRQYALKYAIFHLLDVPKQQESVGTILCNLVYVHEKLQLPGVTIDHVIGDYSHEHYQSSKGKSVKLEDYFKRFPKLMEQINHFKEFLTASRKFIQVSPQHILQIAANYTKMDRIKQNARLELMDKAWVEDLTALPETACHVRQLEGVIKGMDITSDGKTLAVVTRDDSNNIKLHLYNTSTGDLKCAPMDIKNLKDRYGLVVKFMADSSNSFFVGSFSTYVNPAGKQIPGHLDMQTIQMKEKYTIECCDVSSRFLACGLTTIPWSGRSLHICVFDLKSKKCVATVEVLRFRFGGSATFGVRAIALSRTKPFMCACVKMDLKPQLKVLVYNTSRFNVTNSIDVQNENYTGCMVIDEEALVIGSGLRPPPTTRNKDFELIQADTWQFKDVSNKMTELWDSKENHSVFNNYNDGAVCTRWAKASDSIIINIWESPSIASEPTTGYVIRGLSEMAEMCAARDSLVFTDGEKLHFFNTQDMDEASSLSELTGLGEARAENAFFIPRSNTAVISSESIEEDDIFSAMECDIRSEDSMPTVSGFSREPRHVSQYPKYKTYFRGNGNINDVCFCGVDGNDMVFNSGDSLKVYDRATTAKSKLPEFKELGEKATNRRKRFSLRAAASPKENIVAVVYPEAPAVIFILDIKSGKKLRKFVRQGSTPKVAVTDFIFMPSNGYLLSYHRDAESLLCTWNVKLGELISIDNLKMSYAKISPASDRIAISIRSPGNRREGEIILRNSDAKFSTSLILPVDATWAASPEESDVDFSPDGTVIIGVCASSNICRVWNAANGEILHDLNISFDFHTGIVGMLTNTHAVFHNDCLLVVDIATSEVVAMAPVHERLNRKRYRDIKVSARGNAIVGIRENKRLAAFCCHNFATVKRKTTLQIMKSYAK